MTVCDWDTAIHLVELGLGSTIVPSWYAHAASSRSTIAAIPIAASPPYASAGRSAIHTNRCRRPRSSCAC